MELRLQYFFKIKKMRLTKKNTAAYLTNKGFLDMNDLMDGEFLLTQSQSRNSIFQVLRGKKTGLFVKQLVSMDSQNIYLMQKDATVHYMIHKLDIFKNVKPFVPEYFGYDPKTQVLVTEYFSDAQNLVEWSEVRKEVSVDQALEIASILSSFHFDLTEAISTNPSLQFFNRDLPWMFNIFNMPNNQTDVLFKAIEEDEYLSTQLEEIKQNWSGNSLFHGDIKLVNFIVVMEDGKEKVKVIDWEIANIGDPLWDVAGLLQSYLFFWITKLIAGPNGFQLIPGQEYLNASNRNTVTNSFWNAYVEKLGWTKEEEEKAKIKTVKYVAVRLLQSAKELTQLNPNQLSPTAILILQITKSILQSPEAAAKEYLGI